MRGLLGFVVLAVGITAAVMTFAPERPWEVSLIEQKAAVPLEHSRVTGISAIGEGVSMAPVVSSEFQTTVATAPAEPDPSPAVDAAASDDAVPAPAIASGAALDPQTKAALARDIQVELARLGCYAGPANGQWTPDTQRAAGLLVSEANAVMPTTEPDFALLSIARAATGEQACGPAVAIADTPQVERPSMGLGGPADAPKRPAGYHRDREVESLFTNPLGR